MAAFRAGVEGAAPLLAQLESTNGLAVVTELDASGDNALGATSRPLIYRPATPGLWAGFHPIAPTPLGAIQSASSIFVTTFNTPPSIPVAPPTSVKVPFQILWKVPVDQGFIVPPGEVLVLYANTRGGHSWTANLIWEEF